MVEVLLIFFVFLWGLSVGSFLNVLIYRLPHSVAITGRSFCPQCQKKILWSDNIPLLSFIFVGGKCRFCHLPISWQYPLVEIACGIAFILVYLLFNHNIWQMVYHFWLVSVLIAIFVIDLKNEIIPDELVFPTIIVSLPLAAIRWPSTFIIAVAIGLGFFVLHVITRRKGMGLGDVKLAFLIGLVLGFPKAIFALWLAFLTGAVVGVILILGRKKRFGQHISFGPFLCGATLVFLFWGEQILKWLTARFF